MATALRLRAEGTERDVSFTEAAAEVAAEIDTAYHTNYDCSGPKIVDTVDDMNGW